MQMLTTLISTRVTEEKKKSYVSLKPDHLKRSAVAEHQEF